MTKTEIEDTVSLKSENYNDNGGNNTNDEESDDDDFHWDGGINDRDFEKIFNESIKKEKGRKGRSQPATSKDFDFTCVYCGKTFKRIDRLRIHENIHIAVKKYECDICGKSYFAKREIQKHMPKHLIERTFTFKCDQCSMKFVSNLKLTNHLRFVHFKKVFFCSVCGKDFLQKFSVLSHMRVHTGEKVRLKFLRLIYWMLIIFLTAL